MHSHLYRSPRRTSVRHEERATSLRPPHPPCIEHFSTSCDHFREMLKRPRCLSRGHLQRAWSILGRGPPAGAGGLIQSNTYIKLSVTERNNTEYYIKPKTPPKILSNFPQNGFPVVKALRVSFNGRHANAKSEVVQNKSCRAPQASRWTRVTNRHKKTCKIRIRMVCKKGEDNIVKIVY